ncbi:uncharacterized protein [Dysidea avara]|uniref:uncharacterized protein n=1 Tax=Dysidea avara TaxID=196820 RepID=UPI0033184221
MAARKTLTFVTGNPRKLEELLNIVGSSFPFEIVLKSVDLPELQGEPQDIAKEKCLLASKEIKGPLIIEDTCLCFNALQGLPGPYIKWFLQKLGHQGLNNLLTAYEDKSAYALCTIAYHSGQSDSSVVLFEGKTMGKIVPARGPNYFGWDPVFQPDGFDQTYAEMDKAIKNTISHRYRAIKSMNEYFSSLKRRTPSEEPAEDDNKKSKLEK